MSRTILPSDGVPFLFDYCISRSDLKAELPSTAWPCRLRHVPGQSIPTLTFDPQPFRTGLEKLQIERFGSKMQDYKPPSDDPFDDTPDIDVPDASTTDYSRIYYSWKALHQQTRKNLLEFETPGFKLLSNVEGRDQVAKLVSALICDESTLKLHGCIAWATKRHCKTLLLLPTRLPFGHWPGGVAIALCRVRVFTGSGYRRNL